MASAKDIISSIFRKFQNTELSPEFIRDESNNICDILNIARVGDPGRTAREFAEKGFLQTHFLQVKRANLNRIYMYMDYRIFRVWRNDFANKNSMIL